VLRASLLVNCHVPSQQLPDSITSKLPEEAIAEHTATVTTAITGALAGKIGGFGGGDAPTSTSTATTGSSGSAGSALSGVTAGLQKQIDSHSADVTAGLTKQVTALTDKVHAVVLLLCDVQSLIICSARCAVHQLRTVACAVERFDTQLCWHVVLQYLSTA
jgi:hypothetical protein